MTLVSSPPEPVGERELRQAIAVILKRSYPDVRGGVLRGRRGAQAGERAAAAAKVEAGIQAAVLTWEGISSKIGAST